MKKRKIHVVIFGAGDIGAAVARRYALDPDVAHVSFTYRSDEKGAKRLKLYLKKKGLTAYDEKFTEYANHDEVTRFLERAQKAARGIPVSILVNAVGYSPDTPFREQTPDLWHRVFDTNVVGPWFSSIAVANHMVKHKVNGVICIIVTDNYVLSIDASEAPYNFSKNGWENGIPTLAKEYGKNGIRIFGYGPGWVATKMNLTVDEERYKKISEKIILRGGIENPSDTADGIYHANKIPGLHGKIIHVNRGGERG